MKTQSSAIIRFQVPGFHHWQDATGDRAYLAQRHRHLFHVEVKLELHHSCREVEFHDFLDFCRTNFPGGEMGGLSCEHMAENLLKQITDRYPGRSVRVGVFEDGECGAEVRCPP
ncbi:MAG: hypothetical protein KME11_04895 [Timaviella obliquedivisa GSE-PSE-MK23-08B]|jgi:hypothetical protein|nr:hypothetical protein [Timaviella obliquedivisa GSE-PSE-MK23-08B]